MKIELTDKETKFLNAYLEAIDFTETGDIGQAPSGEALDTDYLREATIDCLAFYSRARCYLSDEKIGRAAYDFWFSRQGHGTGFWDREDFYAPGVARMLDRIATSFGETVPAFEDWCLLEA